MSRRDETRYRAAERKLFDAYGVAPIEHTVEIPAYGTALRVLETGAGEPILFIHGSPNTAATWAPLAAAMPGRRCLLLERPGAGLSAPVQRWTHHRTDVVALLTSVLDALGVASIEVVGSSFGGLYAYELAVGAPHRVSRLVIMGAPVGPSMIPMPSIFRFLSLPGLKRLMRGALKPDVAESRKMWTEIGHGESVERGVIPEAMIEWYSSLLCHTDTAEHLLAEIRAIASPLGLRKAARISDAELAALTQPTLYVWGDRDNFARPELGRRACALTPGARFVELAGFGHVPFCDDPARVAALIAPAAGSLAVG